MLYTNWDRENLAQKLEFSGKNNDNAGEHATTLTRGKLCRNKLCDKNMHSIEPRDNPQVPPSGGQNSFQPQTLRLHLKLP